MSTGKPIGETYKKGKSIGEKRLSSMDAFAHVDIPGGHRPADSRDAADALKNPLPSTQPHYDDKQEAMERLQLNGL